MRIAIFPFFPAIQASFYGMCTVTWSRDGENTAVCFSRDERRERATGLPPKVWDFGFLAPVDGRDGGTWLAVGGEGTVLALLNHYPAHYFSPLDTKSRGGMIPAILESGLPICARTLRAVGVERMSPFRLFVLPPGAPVARLFSWDGQSVRSRSLTGGAGIFSSSSWNSAPVLRYRYRRFKDWLGPLGRPPDLIDLKEFHIASAPPNREKWSVLMTRPESHTASLNAIEITPFLASMTHQLRAERGASFQDEQNLIQMPLQRRV